MRVDHQMFKIGDHVKIRDDMAENYDHFYKPNTYYVVNRSYYHKDHDQWYISVEGVVGDNDQEAFEHFKEEVKVKPDFELAPQKPVENPDDQRVKELLDVLLSDYNAGFVAADIPSVFEILGYEIVEPETPKYILRKL